MGTPRSIDDLATKLGYRKSSAKNLRDWSSKWCWQERCLTYDRLIIAFELAQRLASRGSEQHIAEIERLRTDILRAAEENSAMIAKIRKKLLDAAGNIDLDDIKAKDWVWMWRVLLDAEDHVGNLRMQASGVDRVIEVVLGGSNIQADS